MCRGGGVAGKCLLTPENFEIELLVEIRFTINLQEAGSPISCVSLEPIRTPALQAMIQSEF